MKPIVLTYLLLASLSGATSITQYGTTVTFAADETVGQYANGDYWVLDDGNVIINSWTPTTDASGSSRIKNGVMVNPTAGTDPSQGFDSSLGNYSEALNVGNDWPRTIVSGETLLKAVSVEEAGARPQFTDIVILTVVSSVPSSGDFRPPYVGTDKTLWSGKNKSDLDYTILKSLAPPNGGTNVPSLASVEALIDRSWIEIHTSVGGREWHPTNHQQYYGREINYDLNEIVLSLQLDYTNTQKENLYIGLVQYGLDIYAALNMGATWPAKGGHNHGRKLPMLIAGNALNISAIITAANSSTVFQEDLQTFYVTQADIDLCPKYSADGRDRECYTQEMMGMPEWGAQHDEQPIRDGSNWDVEYRQTVGVGIIGEILTAQIMEFKTAWGHNAIFDYADRFWEIEEVNRADALNQIHLFEADMWDAYRYLLASSTSRKTSSFSGSIRGIAVP